MSELPDITEIDITETYIVPGNREWILFLAAMRDMDYAGNSEGAGALYKGPLGWFDLKNVDHGNHMLTIAYSKNLAWRIKELVDYFGAIPYKV